jgi:hypothetical protein
VIACHGLFGDWETEGTILTALGTRDGSKAAV